MSGTTNNMETRFYNARFKKKKNVLAKKKKKTTTESTKTLSSILSIHTEPSHVDSVKKNQASTLSSQTLC